MIYIFTNSYLPILGGIQTVTSQLAEAMTIRGQKCRVITKLYPRKLKICEKIDGVRVFRFPFFSQDNSIKSRFFNLIALLLTFLQFILHKPSIVFVHFPDAQVRTILILRKLFNFKIITCFHGYDIMRYETQQSNDIIIHRDITKRLVDKSAYVTACSKYLTHKVGKLLNPHCPILPIYNGVNLARFIEVPPEDPTSNRKYLFAWGRLEKIKGFHLLIEAFSQIAQIYTSLDLIIAGEGSQRDELEKMISDYKLSKRIFLPGKKSQSEIVILSKNSKINIIPSIFESFGIVGLEAIAAGRPIVCTNTGGLSEFMTNFATIVEPDANSIKDGIVLGMNKSALDPNLVAKFLDNFSVSKMVDNYLSLINEY